MKFTFLIWLDSNLDFFWCYCRALWSHGSGEWDTKGVAVLRQAEESLWEREQKAKILTRLQRSRLARVAQTDHERVRRAEEVLLHGSTASAPFRVASIRVRDQQVRRLCLVQARAQARSWWEEELKGKSVDRLGCWSAETDGKTHSWVPSRECQQQTLHQRKAKSEHKSGSHYHRECSEHSSRAGEWVWSRWRV